MKKLVFALASSGAILAIYGTPSVALAQAALPGGAPTNSSVPASAASMSISADGLDRTIAPTFACTETGNAFDKRKDLAKKLLDSYNGGPLPEGCWKVKKGYYFQGVTAEDGLIYGSVPRTAHTVNDVFFYIPARDVVEVLDAAGRHARSPCSGLTGPYITQQLVRAPGGQLYLVRFLMKPSCVNGVVRYRQQRVD